MRLAIALVALWTTTAAAQPPGLTPPTITYDVPAVPQDKNETTATVLGLVGVGVPIAMMGAGLVLDKAWNSDPNADDNEPMGITIFAIGALALIPGSLPARGYTNHVPWLNMGVRLLAVSVAVGGALELSDARRCKRGEYALEECADVSEGGGGVMLATGLAAYVGSTIYDIVTARREVREWNRRRAKVVPMVSGTSAGLAVQLPL